MDIHETAVTLAVTLWCGSGQSIERFKQHFGQDILSTFNDRNKTINSTICKTS